jgi:hypothetical protein
VTKKAQESKRGVHGGTSVRTFAQRGD